MAGRERETPPAQERGGLPPDCRVPGLDTAATYSGGGRRLCSFLSSRPFQYLKLLSKCCIRLGRSAKAGETTKKLKHNIRYNIVLLDLPFLYHYSFLYLNSGNIQTLTTNTVIV